MRLHKAMYSDWKTEKAPPAGQISFAVYKENRPLPQRRRDL